MHEERQKMIYVVALTANVTKVTRIEWYIIMSDISKREATAMGITIGKLA